MLCPWAMSLCLSDNKLFFRPKAQNLHIFHDFYWMYLIWYYCLSVKFVIELWNRKLKVTNYNYKILSELSIISSSQIVIMWFQLRPSMIVFTLLVCSSLKIVNLDRKLFTKWAKGIGWMSATHTSLYNTNTNKTTADFSEQTRSCFFVQSPKFGRN